MTRDQPQPRSFGRPRRPRSRVSEALELTNATPTADLDRGETPPALPTLPRPPPPPQSANPPGLSPRPRLGSRVRPWECARLGALIR